MPLIHCNFFSQVLGICTSMDVILPLPKFQEDAPAHPEPTPTLYLLHGYSDDHTIWQRRTSIERYADAFNLAVVMPNAYLSFYTDMAVGLRYFTFISEEVPYVARSLFHLSSTREDNFVAGLSMGGYGAFKVALSKPEQFSCAASLSGALDAAAIAKTEGKDPRQRGFELIFGDINSVKGSENDLFALAKKTTQKPELMPRLYQYCGTEDFLYGFNKRFCSHVERLKYDLTYVEGPGGHTWDRWDEQIQRVLEWLPLERL